MCATVLSLLYGFFSRFITCVSVSTTLESSEPAHLVVPASNVPDLQVRHEISTSNEIDISALGDSSGNLLGSLSSVAVLMPPLAMTGRGKSSLAGKLQDSPLTLPGETPLLATPPDLAVPGQNHSYTVRHMVTVSDAPLQTIEITVKGRRCAVAETVDFRRLLQTYQGAAFLVDSQTGQEVYSFASLKQDGKYHCGYGSISHAAGEALAFKTGEGEKDKQQGEASGGEKIGEACDSGERTGAAVDSSLEWILETDLEPGATDPSFSVPPLKDQRSEGLASEQTVSSRRRLVAAEAEAAAHSSQDSSEAPPDDLSNSPKTPASRRSDSDSSKVRSGANWSKLRKTNPSRGNSEEESETPKVLGPSSSKEGSFKIPSILMVGRSGSKGMTSSSRGYEGESDSPEPGNNVLGKKIITSGRNTPKSARVSPMSSPKSAGSISKKKSVSSPSLIKGSGEMVLHNPARQSSDDADEIQTPVSFHRTPDPATKSTPFSDAEAESYVVQ
eukprot:gb/GEZN01006405.1/.p1 GENE.gb/GEZN01006405.1/~~gb/GEZN01006405.1/.p1  ORF type:complete len:555 (+),score=55.62 gb/GEZN01006405.1/:165-1667(+)